MKICYILLHLRECCELLLHTEFLLASSFFIYGYVFGKKIMEWQYCMSKYNDCSVICSHAKGTWICFVSTHRNSLKATKSTGNTLSTMSNIQTNSFSKLDSQNIYQYTRGKWLIHGIKEKVLVALPLWATSTTDWWISVLRRAKLFQTGNSLNVFVCLSGNRKIHHIRSRVMGSQQRF